MTNVEKELFFLVKNDRIAEATNLLNEHDELISTPSNEEIVNCISYLLIRMGEFEECLDYSKFYLSRYPCANLYYNQAYAYEQLGEITAAIRSYQYAKIFSINADLRSEAHIKIQRLRYPNLEDSLFQELILHLAQVKEYVVAQLNNPSRVIDLSEYIKQPNPVENIKPYILYGTIDKEDHMIAYCNFFFQKKYDVIGINYNATNSEYKDLFSHKLEDLTLENTRMHYIENAADLICDYNVFHFFFNNTLMPDSSDIIPIKMLKKSILMQNDSINIRMLDTGLNFNFYGSFEKVSELYTQKLYELSASDRYLDQLYRQKKYKKIADELDKGSFPNQLFYKIKLWMISGEYQSAYSEVKSLLHERPVDVMMLSFLTELSSQGKNTGGVFHYANQLHRQGPSYHMYVKMVYQKHLLEIDTSTYVDYTHFDNEFEYDITYAIYNNLITQEELLLLIKKILPSALIVELYRGCNLKCPLCPLQGHKNMSKNLVGMPSKFLDSLIQDKLVMNRLKHIYLHNLGESLLNGDALKHISNIKKAFPRIQLMLDTNLSMKIEHKELVQSGIDEITVAIDGYDQESYSRYRVNGHFELVLKNIREIVEVKKDINSKTPRIVGKTIMFRHLENKLDEIEKITRNLGLDSIVIRKPLVFNPDNDKYTKVNIDDWVSIDSKYSRYEYSKEEDSETLGKANKQVGCMGILTMYAPTINADGNVFPCCFLSTEDEYAFGNIGVERFSDIWFSEKYIKFRFDAFLNRTAHNGCKFCNLE